MDAARVTRIAYRPEPWERFCFALIGVGPGYVVGELRIANGWSRWTVWVTIALSATAAWLFLRHRARRARALETSRSRAA